MGRALIVSIPVLFLCGLSSSRAQSRLPPTLRQVGFDQKLGAQVPLDLPFHDEAGQTVRIGDFVRDKPVILVLAYLRCPMLCSQVLNGLVRAMLDLPFDVGKEFAVLTVSFDPRETPQMAAGFKASYVERYGRPGAAQGWHFLTGDTSSIKPLTEAVGFRYVYDAEHDQFAHASGIVLLTPSGKVSRYFYDIRFPARDLRLGLVEASENRIGSASDRVLLFCFHYDPVEGKYGLAVMNFVRLGGVLTVLGIVGFVLVLRRKDPNRERKVKTTVG